MARQVLPFVGAIVGSFFGAPQIGFMIGSLVGNIVDPQIIKGPSIGDGQTQTSKEGVPRPIVYGTACVAGNIIDRSEIYKSIKRTRQGKGGPVTEEERMHLTYAIRICEGPIAGLLRIWEDEKLVYDIRSNGQVSSEENAKYEKNFRFYPGSETQNPDPELEVVHGAGNAPSYRGTCYIVFPRMDVTDRRGSVPTYRFEVAAEAQEISVGAAFTVSTAYENIPPEFLSPVQQLDWEFSARGYSQLTAQFQDVSPNTDILALVCEHSSTDQINILVQTRQSDETFQLTHELIDGDGFNASRVMFTRDGRYMIAFLSPSDSETIAGVHSKWKTFRVDDGSFSLVHDEEFSAPYCTSIGYGSMGAMLNPAGTKIFASMAYRSPSQSYSTFGFFNVSANGFVFVDVDDIASYDDVPFGFDGGSRGIDWSPNGRYVVQSSSNFHHTFDSQYDSISQSYINTYNTGSAGGGACFSESGNNIFMFTQNALSNVIARFADFDGTNGIHNVVNITETGSPNFVRTHGSVSKDRKFFACGTLSSQQGAGNTIGCIYALDEVNKSASTYQVITSPYSQGPQSRLILPHVQVSNIADGSNDTLAHIIEDISDRCGIDLDQVDVDEVLDVPVRGFVIAQQYAANNAIRSLQNSFFFDPAEWDEKVRIVLRGKPVQTTITVDQMFDDEFQRERKNAFEFPRKLELMYQNSTIGYDSAKAVAFRNDPTLQSSGLQTLEVPVVFNEDEAAQVADKQLKIAWAEVAGEVTFSVSYEYDWITPTDCVGVYLNAEIHRVRIERIERADGVLNMVGKIDRQSAYTSNVTGVPIPPPTPPPPTIAGNMIFQFLNIPALADPHDALGLGYYVAGTGTSEAYHGGVVERSVAGEEFTQVASIPVGVTMGYLLEPLAAASEHYPDTTNRILVQLYTGQLESVDDITLLRENNGIAIARPDGTAEILQFRDADDLGDGIYELSYLIRGRLNSGATEHVDGAVLVFLEDVRIVAADASMIGQEITHRPTSYGEDPEESDQYIDTLQPVLMQTEFPVEFLDAEVVGSTVNATWSPRERFGTDVHPIRSVNWQHYRIVLNDGSNQIEAISLNPSASIDASTLSGTTTITVYQVNRLTGDGPGVSVTVEL